ncbi:MAG: 2-oxo acid dehydrogenase subunit E2, partial [Firmicutes bacterium]|nr:2-oxo acid dehydrogenase subunit E2 [Bacillota bacterium]
QLGLAELHRVISELSEKARAGKLTQDDLAGGTFTVSNLGMYGIDAFTPVLNPPQSAILGLGAIREVPVLRNGTALPGHGMILSLTIDHRVVDGAPGARFLAAVRALLEQPGRLVV